MDNLFTPLSQQAFEDRFPEPPYQVRTAGCVDRRAYHSTPGTHGGDIMLTVFLDGAGTYRNTTGTVRVTGGMAGLVPPDDPGILMADPDDPYLHYYCRFRGTYASAEAQSILRARGARFFRIGHAADVADCLRRMGSYHRRGDLPKRVGRREALLAQALALLAENPESNPDSTRTINHDTLREYLSNHVDEPTDLDRVAAHFHVSKTTLCRQARTRCGQTVQQMHERMKVEWAQSLLRGTRLHINEVARHVGYDDPYYFSRVFRKCTGRSPRAWRQQGQHGGPAV